MRAPRRGNAGAAASIAVLTLILTALLGGCAALLNTDWSGLCYTNCGRRTGLAVLMGTLAALCLVGGLWAAWWTGAHGSERQGLPTSAPPCPTWLVGQSGAGLTDLAGGGFTLWQVDAGTLVTEVQRVGSQLRVTTPDGLTGWVAADRLEPTGDEEGGRDG